MEYHQRNIGIANRKKHVFKFLRLTYELAFIKEASKTHYMIVQIRTLFYTKGVLFFWSDYYYNLGIVKGVSVWVITIWQLT